MAAYTGAGRVLTGAGEAQELDGVAVAGDIFAVLGVRRCSAAASPPKK